MSSQTCFHDQQIHVFSIVIVFVMKMKGKTPTSSQCKTRKIYELFLFETKTTLNINFDKQIYSCLQISLKRVFCDINLNFVYKTKDCFRMDSLLEKDILYLARTPIQCFLLELFDKRRQLNMRHLLSYRNKLQLTDSLSFEHFDKSEN